MKKNMYSLMLSEDVVGMIDRLAYSAGTNRSNMINNILAEYLSYKTPEMRIKEMMERLSELFSPGESLQVTLRPSLNTFALRSALAFKYNPTINYQIEFYRTAGSAIGELRAGLRTQNPSLKLAVMQFYKLWSRIEASYRGTSESAAEDERFTKTFRLAVDGKTTDGEISSAIADYVRAFDGGIKAFFYNLNDPQRAVAAVEEIYRDYYRGAAILM